MMSVSMKINELLELTIKEGASDLHLSAGNPPLLRKNGDIIVQSSTIITNEEILEALESIMPHGELQSFKEKRESDFSFNFDSNNVPARFRVNAFEQLRGYGAVLRVIPNKILTLDELGLGDTFKNLCTRPRGLILVTGPTGSGKSTTLAAMIDHINRNEPKHILTIEDPIEFVHSMNKSLINQREVHKHTESFSNALRAALREDPDVILVGELRDLETIRLALTAAETGHLVFGTLHTTSASKTIDRIIDVFPPEEKDTVRTMLSESLEAVISQTLIKKVGGGRIAAHEIMLGIPAIRNLIRENKVAQMYSAIQTGSSSGMVTLDQSLQVLIKDKKITTAQAKILAKDASKF